MTEELDYFLENIFLILDTPGFDYIKSRISDLKLDNYHRIIYVDGGIVFDAVKYVVTGNFSCMRFCSILCSEYYERSFTDLTFKRSLSDISIHMQFLKNSTNSLIVPE
jgi:hypothetical protein